MEKETSVKNELTKVEKGQLAESMGLVVPKNLTDKVLNSLEVAMKDGHLHLPKDYSLSNAMKSAYLKLQETVDKTGTPVLKSCTESSIVNALLFTAIAGLTPARDQIYYIAYGKTLKPMTSVFGKMALVSRLPGVETVPVGKIIYEGDKIVLGENELGEELIVTHERTWESRTKNKITGGYATIVIDGITRSAILTMQELLESWSKSKTDKKHELHQSEFVKRSCIARLLKPILNSSSDGHLIMGSGSSFNTEALNYNPDTGEIIDDKKTPVKELKETTIQEGSFEEAADTPNDPAPQNEENETAAAEGSGQGSLDFGDVEDQLSKEAEERKHKGF